MAKGSMTTNSTVDVIDKTLTISGAPADAAAAGEALDKKANKDVILDDEGNVIFYSKSAVDELLAGKLDLTGGTMTGMLLGKLDADVSAIEFTKTVTGDNMIRFRNTATGADVGIGIGGLGTGIGIWDFKQEQWIINGILDEKSIFIGGTYCAGFVVASGSNYVRFGDGTQICWEIGAYVDGYITETNRRVNFPVAFSSNPAIVAASNANVGNTTVLVGWESTTGFTIGETSGNLRGNTNWIAIGRWK